MAIHEFDDAIPVETPLGRGDAILFESTAHDQFWTVILRDTRAIVTFKQRLIRAERQYTAQRSMSDEQMLAIISGKPRT